MSRLVAPLFTTVVIILALVVGLNRIHTSDYSLTPGHATPVAPLVKINGVTTNSHPDTIMLADVYLTSLTVWQWISAHFRAHTQIVGANELVPSNVPVDELNAQGFLEMYYAKQAAEVEAFRTVGWRVPLTPSGAIIGAVVAPSPARVAGLHVGDQVIAVNGTTVTSACQLIAAVRPLAPGTSVTLRVNRVRISKVGELSWRSTSSLTLRTVAPPRAGPSGCTGVTGRERSFLGISPVDAFNDTLPATVSINTANIGGPSAGLAMTLTLIDELSRGSLTGGHKIAVTGTISTNGQVGDVGGVAQKTVAVERAGAQYFIVPTIEVSTARANAGPGLKVIGVTTLKEALRALKKIGGDAPTALSRPS